MVRRRRRARNRFSGPVYEKRVEALGRAIERAYTAWPFHTAGQAGRMQRAERYVASKTVIALWKRHKRRYSIGNQRRRGWLR